jgi:plasmid stability protein
MNQNRAFMNIVLELPEALEHRLREEAARHGVSLNRHIVERLGDKSSDQEDMPLTEGALLQKINLGIEEEEWNRFHALVALRKSEQISEAAQQELIALTDKIEAANAARLPYLVELARLRNVTLAQLMNNLGLNAPLFLYD